MIYLIRANNTGVLVKLGYSESIAQRVRAIASEADSAVTLEAVLPGDRSDEKAAHEALNAVRLEYCRSTEWFLDGARLRAWLDAQPVVIRPGIVWRRGGLGYWYTDEDFEVIRAIEGVQRQLAKVDPYTLNPEPLKRKTGERYLRRVAGQIARRTSQAVAS